MPVNLFSIQKKNVGQAFSLTILVSLFFSACSQASQNITPTLFVTEVDVEETESIVPVRDGSDFVFLSLEENGFAHLFMYQDRKSVV